MNNHNTPEILIVGQSTASELPRLNNLFQSLGYHSSLVEWPQGPLPPQPLRPWSPQAASDGGAAPINLSLIHWPTCKDNTRGIRNNPVAKACSGLSDRCAMALFGCERSKALESDALRAGLDGVFFADERPEVIAKGVAAILKGELWFSRALLGEVIRNWRRKYEEETPERDDVNHRLQSLTRRERAVIELLTLGARNKEIADELNISAHTVKAHIYSIFKKTKSRNRVEVINWANQFLTAPPAWR